jgi:YesN/AraC family two-component response regulator
MHRVLVIDDDQGTLETFQAILRLAGFDVAVAANGRTALDVARRYSYDVVLCDLRLPDMTGVDVLRALQQEGIERPFVIMTAFGSVGTAVRALKLGARDYVEKPITDTQLIDIVRQATNSEIITDEGQTTSDEWPTGDTGRADADPVSAPAGSLMDWRIVESLQIIREKYSTPDLRLARIARELNTSTEHLCRLFKRNTGTGFAVHLHRTRANEARQLLVETNLCVKEIAFRVGYATTRRLDHYFKRFYGVLPVEFRRRALAARSRSISQ